jgi:hypothetical protein
MKTWQPLVRIALLGVLGLVLSAPVAAGEKVIAQNLVFNSIEPCLVLDTSKTAEGPLMAGETRTFTVVGEADLTLQGGESATGCGIPGYVEKLPRASAIVVNLVAKPVVGSGDLRLWASDRPMPRNATMSFSPKSAWRNVGVGLVVALRQDGAGEDISLHATEQVDVVATVVGYYSKLGLAEDLPLAVVPGGVKLSGATEAAGTRDTMVNLTLTGSTGLSLTHSLGKVLNSAGCLLFQMTGDQYGSVKMSLQNRFGVNGVLFEQSSVGNLIDFVLKAGTFQRNLRLEGRSVYQYTSGHGPEFQLGYPYGVGTGPNLIVADSESVFRLGNVGIGTTAAPWAKLQVSGGSETPAIYGETTSTNGDGVYGVANTGTSAYGLRGQSSQGIGVYASGGAYGGYFSGPKTYVSGNLGVGTTAPAYKLDVTSTANLNKGVTSGTALRVNSAEALWYNGDYFSWGYGANWNYFADRVAIGTSTPAVNTKLYVQSDLYNGVYGYTTYSGGNGVYGIANNGASAYGIYGVSSGGYAGYFSGKVHVNGTLSKSAGSFKIDHPLDPANKYLSHSFVESPDMMNIYNGNVVLDRKGEAVVKLPDWFGALNRDYRYQLTAIGQPGPDLYVAEEIANGQFTIAGGADGMKVSWQVTGIRQDAYANAHRIPVEEDKPKAELGSYLHPELFGQPAEKGVEWATKPEMRQ